MGVTADTDELRRLRRARDQMDRDYAHPLDVATAAASEPDAAAPAAA